jgi:integrase
MSFIQISIWQPYDDAGHRKYVTSDESRRFLEEADRLRPDLRALCYLLTLTGCRISEALALCGYQLDVERRTLTFRTLKRRRPVFRTVPIPQDLVTMLIALPDRAGGKLWQMHRATAWRQVKRAMIRARVYAGPQACPRGLRHGYGIHAASRSIPPNLIQRWMGHASPTTTAIYLDAVGLEEREFANRMW